jgi:hypothetical protein
LTWKERYSKAHLEYFKREYPIAYKDGHYPPVVYPKVAKSNGLQMFIINFINWSGYRAKRINVQGRLIDKVTTGESGAKFRDKFWIKAGNRYSADVSSTIKGRSCQWEVKVGLDKPSDGQLAEQAKERRAGGIYEFVHTPEEFLTLFDQITANIV